MQGLQGAGRFNEAAGIHRRKRVARVLGEGTTECFNEAAGIHRRKPAWTRRAVTGRPRFNEAAGIHRRKPAAGDPVRRIRLVYASMRPPEFTGGNADRRPGRTTRTSACFNEAAGIHRRKRRRLPLSPPSPPCFNEAAGIHRRKRAAASGAHRLRLPASMRPPEFTGGNPWCTWRFSSSGASGFNEAAGIHRRKQYLTFQWAT